MRSSIPSTSSITVGAFAAAAAYLASTAWGQSYQTHNLTPDGYWHNRYHMVLSMAAYGDYNTVCPNETFTEEAEHRNFPDATRPPWTLVNTFGPTPSGAQGYTAIIPEMNKALIIFQGNYGLEQSLPLDVIPWSQTNGTTGPSILPSRCYNCTVNKYAWQGYLEAKEATNNWEAIRGQYEGQGLVFSIAGHGLGGMHAQIAGIDLYEQQIDYYNHAYGSPRVFNAAGSQWYADRFNGEAGERGIANNDMYTEFIPEGPNYAHTGTPFYYWGHNSSSTGMNWDICWLEDDPDYSACMPRDQGLGTTAEQDHYFYFTPVTHCGAPNNVDVGIVNAWLDQVKSNAQSASLSSSTSAPPSTSSAPAQTGTGGPASATGTPTQQNQGSSGSRTVVSVLAIAAAAAVALL